MYGNNNRYIAVWLPLLLLACTGDLRDLDRFVEETKQKHHGFVEPLPFLEPYQRFQYDSSTLRDPFMALVEIRSGLGEDELRPNEERARESLESYTLKSLRMVGYFSRDDETLALILSPDNVTHSVRLGNYLGENFGEVLNIDENGLVLKEHIPDGLGGWRERVVELVIGEQPQIPEENENETP